MKGDRVGGSSGEDDTGIRGTGSQLAGHAQITSQARTSQQYGLLMNAERGWGVKGRLGLRLVVCLSKLRS